jgi:hypothetical protein
MRGGTGVAALAVLAPGAPRPALPGDMRSWPFFVWESAVGAIVKHPAFGLSRWAEYLEWTDADAWGLGDFAIRVGPCTDSRFDATEPFTLRKNAARR